MNNEMTALAAWENFYVIVGSSAGALIGLQFVVITLIAGIPIPDAARAGGAFATPTVVHFGAVLLLSGILSAPWEGIGAVSAIWGLLGIAGIFYVVVVGNRMRVQTAYRPVLEDWMFNLFLPGTAYAILAGSAYAVHSDIEAALFAVGASAMLLLFVGIHNAWDAVTYHLFVARKKYRGSDRPGEQ